MAASQRPRSPQRTFVFRAGTRIAGTVIACDASGGSDLLFVSNAAAYAREGAPRRARLRPGRGQVVATAETLALLDGGGSQRLRGRALAVSYGRPFTLGSVRIELVPSGFLPGAAALACDAGGGRRVLYAGAARLGAAALGAAPGEARTVEALCLDATFGHPRFSFVERDEAAAAALAFARDARDAGCAPVILAAPLGPALDLAAALAAGAAWKLRGHRAVVAAAAAYRSAGVAAVPAIGRFAGALARDEVLLWPPSAHGAGQIGRLGPARTAWFSGFAAEPDAALRLHADKAVPYSNHADFAGLLRYVAASGAREIAVQHGAAEDFAQALRERGLTAYVVGPPSQTLLRWGEHFPEK